MLLTHAGCRSCTLNAHDVALLNDKIKFSRFARQHGLKTPDTIPITSPDQLRSLNARCGHNCERLPFAVTHVSACEQLCTIPYLLLLTKR